MHGLSKAVARCRRGAYLRHWAPACWPCSSPVWCQLSHPPLRRKTTFRSPTSIPSRRSLATSLSSSPKRTKFGMRSSPASQPTPRSAFTTQARINAKPTLDGTLPRPTSRKLSCRTPASTTCCAIACSPRATWPLRCVHASVAALRSQVLQNICGLLDIVLDVRRLAELSSTAARWLTQPSIQPCGLGSCNEPARVRQPDRCSTFYPDWPAPGSSHAGPACHYFAQCLMH